MGTPMIECTSEGGVNVLMKSRWRLTKSCGGAEDLVIGWSRTIGDTRRDRGGSVVDSLLQLVLVVLTLKP